MNNLGGVVVWSAGFAIGAAAARLTLRLAPKAKRKLHEIKSRMQHKDLDAKLQAVG